MEGDPDHYLIAIEHYLWCREQGMSERDILEALDFRPPPYRPLTSEYIVTILAAYHRGLCHREKAA